MSRLDKLSKDALFSIAIMLDLPDLLRFCDSNKRVDELICKKNDIWYNKLVNEFPNWKEFKIFKEFNKDLKDIYETLYGLKVVQKFLGDTPYKDYSLLELYNLKTFILSYGKLYKHLTEIPKEIGNIKKLEKLSLFNNQLTEIPEELGNLTNLQELYLNDNKLTEIPKELGNLNNLKYLFLSYNKLTKIPKEMGNLTNLHTLNLSNNQLTEIPKELGNLTKLEELLLDKKTEIPKEVRDIKGLKIIN